MQCIQCPPALSDVVTEFASGQHVCRACGLVVPARRVYEDDAAARSVPTHTRLSMQRLAPSSSGSGGGSGGGGDGDSGSGRGMSASMALVMATSDTNASLPPVATSANTMGKRQTWGGNLLMQGVGRGRHAATQRDVSARSIRGGSSSNKGKTSLGCSTNGGLFHLRRRENQRSRVLKALQLTVQDACVAVGLNQMSSRGAENIMLECVHVLQSSADGSEGGGSGGGSGRHQRTLQKSKHGALSAAAVFVSCRQQQCARTVNEVCSLTGVNEKSFRKAYKTLTEVLNGMRVPPATPEQFMGRFRTAFKWDYAVERVAIGLVERARRCGRLPSSSHAPAAVAAAALHNASAGGGGGQNASLSLAVSATRKVNRRLSKQRYGGAQPSGGGKPPSLHALAKRLGLGLSQVKRARDVLARRPEKAAGAVAAAVAAATGVEAAKAVDEGVVEDALTSSLSGGKARGDSPRSDGTYKMPSRPATPGTEHALTDCEESNSRRASEGSGQSRKTDMFIHLVNDLES
jgi:hypothetical protein